MRLWCHRFRRCYLNLSVDSVIKSDYPNCPLCQSVQTGIFNSAFQAYLTTLYLATFLPVFPIVFTCHANDGKSEVL